MAPISIHFEDCERLLGKGYIEVHRDLDEMANKYPPPLYLEYHRQFRHTENYIEKFKYYEKLAAKIHIIRDYELYVLNKPFYLVEIEEIGGLWEKVKQYLHKGKVDNKNDWRYL